MIKLLKYAYFIFIFLFFPGTGISIAQNKTVDSAEYATFIEEADKWSRSGNHEKAIQYLLQAADLLENSEDRQALPGVYGKLADIYKIKGAYENAIDYYIKTIDYSDINDNASISSCYEKLGDLYGTIQNTDKALASFLFASAIYEKGNRHDDLLRISGKIMSVYRLRGEFQKSLDLGLKMFKMAGDGKNEKQQFILVNSIGYDQFRLGNYTEANASFREAFQKGQENKASSKELINILINRSVCLFNISKPRDAIETLKKASELNISDTDYDLQATIENLIATIYLHLNDLYNADIFINASIMSARKSGNAYVLQECYNTCSKVLKAGNDPIKALEYYEKYLALRDSLSLEDRLAENEKSRNQFDLEKLEKEFRLKIASENIYEMRYRQMEMEQARQREITQQQIDSLEQARRLANLELDKQRQQTEKERVDRENQTLQYQNELQQREITLNGIEEQQRLNEIKRLEIEKEQEKKMKKYAIVIVVLLIFVAVTILFGFITTKNKNTLLASQKKEIQEKNYYLEQLNEEISTQKEMIEEKNIAITDSIQYAQKIQSAVLPPEDFLRENLREYFILFRPRDIVSGDFYWGTRKDDKLVITAADCTGHGVPGAFMSMLGTAFLNEIVNESELVESDKILNQLRKNVIDALRQTGESGEASDGMDIALCIINLKKQVLQFSGANNSMYFISDQVLTEIKPDRMPIGIHVNYENPFNKQDIPYTKGDVFYIFSDGYTDQFGGLEGRKLMHRRFKSLLLENHLKPMHEQMEILENTFKQWKGLLEQVDDVLVIGVRL